jgi:hypothetical protein
MIYMQATARPRTAIENLLRKPGYCRQQPCALPVLYPAAVLPGKELDAILHEELKHEAAG